MNLHRVICGAIIFVATVAVVRLTLRDAAWVDERGHLGAGCHAWATGRFELYRVNPPLVRVLAAFPVVLSGFPVYGDVASDVLMRKDAEGYVDRRIVRLEWDYANTLKRAAGERFERWITTGRWMLIPFFIGSSVMVCHWATWWAGPEAGRFALLGWCGLPEAINWAARITPDSTFTFSFLLFWYLGWRVAVMPSQSSIFSLGLAWGLCLLIKTTAIILPAVLWAAWLSRHFILKRPPLTSIQTDFKTISCVVAIGLVVLNLAYGSSQALPALGEMEFVSAPMTGLPDGEIGNRFRSGVLSSVPLPLPRDFLLGVDLQKAHFDAGGQSFFHGMSSSTGWWWYYLAAMPFKVPLGYLAIAVLTVVLGLFRLSGGAANRPDIANLMYLMIPVTVLWVLVSSQTGHSRNLRYLLPTMPLMVIAMSTLVTKGKIKRLAWCLLCAGVLETTIAYPHLFNFANISAGGPIQAHRWFRISSYDPGIEDRIVERWRRQNAVWSPRPRSYRQLVDCGATLSRSDRTPTSVDAATASNDSFVIVNRGDAEKLHWPVNDAVRAIGCTRLVYCVRMEAEDTGVDSRLVPLR